MLVLSVVLMVPAAAAVVGFFLDDVAAAVEARHYPGLPPAQRARARRSRSATRCASSGWWWRRNLAALVGLPAGAAAGAVRLLGGQRLPARARVLPARRACGGSGRPEAAALGRRHFWRIWLAGTAMAVPLSVPVLNLVVPILGVAVFTHQFHRLAPPADGRDEKGGPDGRRQVAPAGRCRRSAGSSAGRRRRWPASLLSAGWSAVRGFVPSAGAWRRRRRRSRGGSARSRRRSGSSSASLPAGCVMPRGSTVAPGVDARFASRLTCGARCRGRATVSPPQRMTAQSGGPERDGRRPSPRRACGRSSGRPAPRRGCRAPPRRPRPGCVRPIGSATSSVDEPDDREEHEGAGDASRLLELHQRAGEVLGVQEQHRLAVGADLRLAVAEHAGALRQQPVAGGERCPRPRSRGGGCRRPGSWRGSRRSARRRPSGCSSSILVFGSSMKTTVTPCSGSSCGGADRGAEGVAVLRRGRGEVGHGDGDVVEAADHGRPPVRPRSLGRRGAPARVARRSTRKSLAAGRLPPQTRAMRPAGIAAAADGAGRGPREAACRRYR